MRNRSGVFSFSFLFFSLIIDEQREGWGEMIHRSWINLITHTQQAIVREGETLDCLFSFFLFFFRETTTSLTCFGLLERKKKIFFWIKKTKNRIAVESLSHDDESRSLPKKKKTTNNWLKFWFFVVVFVCRTIDRSVERHKSTWRDSSFSMAIITQRLWYYYSSSHKTHKIKITIPNIVMKEQQQQHCSGAHLSSGAV